MEFTLEEVKDKKAWLPQERRWAQFCQSLPIPLAPSDNSGRYRRTQNRDDPAVPTHQGNSANICFQYSGKPTKLSLSI